MVINRIFIPFRYCSMNILIFISFLVLLLNIPFGYWRSNVSRFTLQWFLAIHIPVPIIVIARIWSGIGFEWFTYVFLVSTFFIGQQIGGILNRKAHRSLKIVSSCLFMDMVRCIRLLVL